jgi:hypothetical protein
MATTKMKHEWAVGGVSGYPLSHPIVGQGEFFARFRHFIRLVEHDQEGFVQIFAIIAQWGVGKSRLGYELIAQMNDTSRGWFVRQPDGSLAEGHLFDPAAVKDKYLGLYIRYSQIATRFQNVDNWFGFGLYKALAPMAKDQTDASIQGRVAREAASRLMVKGFDPARLAKALETEQGYSDQQLFEDPVLVTRLCDQAYAYLRELGIEYVVVVLDELETAAEAATYGLEQQDMKPLDGRAIKMIGTAIKEEDPRKKLPWLRYVALCSSAIGHELRQVQSTARRFEVMELHQNVFADVSDFVAKLQETGCLEREYPAGTIEAAYAMSGGNFGWFNVIMANVDQVLRDQAKRVFTVGELFDETVHRSNRVRDYVLDHTALSQLTINPKFKDAAKELLFGQLPRPAADGAPEQREALLAARNEYDEPIAVPYQRVEWDEEACAKALKNAKFVREKERWRLQGVDEALDLRQLLANLHTYAIHETAGRAVIGGRHTLLIPTRERSFIALVDMLYPHPAAEDAARALWRTLVGSEPAVGAVPSHIGPSMEMLGRLNLRLRRQTYNALLFRSPDENESFEKAIKRCKGQPESARRTQALVGAMRLIDDCWEYDAADAGLKGEFCAIQTPKTQARKGLLNADGLRLHPEGRLVLAYVRNEGELRALCLAASTQAKVEGRTPVIALTAFRPVCDVFEAGPDLVMQNARSYLLLYQLSTSEEFLLHEIGLPRGEWQGFQIVRPRFSSAFDARLQALLRAVQESVNKWRQVLQREGHIAWPWRCSGKLKDGDREILVNAWKIMLFGEKGRKSLPDLDETSGVPAGTVAQVLEKLTVSPKARSAGYETSEHAGLFEPLSDVAEAVFPPFLCQLANGLLAGETWTLDRARERWFWGYIWEGHNAHDIFADWMSLLVKMGFARESGTGTSMRDKRYVPVPLSEFAGLHKEAENWLKKDIPALVRQMAELYGEGRISDLFAPLGTPKPGVKITMADSHLKGVSVTLEECRVEQDNYKPQEQNLGQQAESLVKNARRRIQAESKTAWVYERKGYAEIELQGEKIKTVNFEDDTVPLWERVGKANGFAAYVRKAQETVTERVGDLQAELTAEVTTMPGFPLQVFTRALEKVRSILGVAVDPGGGRVGDTWKVQYDTDGTLANNLRGLRLADAVNQLGRLGAELGIDDFVTKATCPIETAGGHVIPAFKDLRARFADIRDLLQNHSGAIQQAVEILKDAPADYGYPPTVPALDSLKTMPATIEAELQESIQEDIEKLIAANEKTMRLGNFQPLMQEVRKLYDAPKAALGRLSGHLATLQNSIEAYRGKVLADSSIGRIETALNALLRAKGHPAHAELTPADISASSLLAARQVVVERERTRRQEGAELLAPTGVSFERWMVISGLIEARQNPELAAAEDRALVDAGFLQRTYAFGVKAP